MDYFFSFERNREMGGLEEVPARVRHYFLTPCDKWNNGRKPFKLVTQIIKIIIITIQIYRFGSITQGEFLNFREFFYDLLNFLDLEYRIL